MLSNLKYRLYIGFATAILLVIAVGFISYITFNNQFNEASRVKHSYRVINQLTTVQNMLVDMETGRRGFRSTNEKLFLEPYTNALQKIGPAVKQAEYLVSDNESQRIKILTLADSINNLLNYWRSLGNNASNYTREIISGINLTEKTKMDVIRANIQQIMDVETGQLNQREASSLKKVKLASTLLISGIALILVIVCILISLILKEFNRRNQAELKLIDNNQKLEIANQASQEKNWLLAGHALLNKHLQGVQTTKDVCSKTLQTITDYLHIDAGAIYLMNEQDGALVRTAYLGLKENSKSVFKLNEGFVGKAAGKTDLLHIKEVPKNLLIVEGGIVSVNANEIVYAPLHRNNELKGVLEISTLKMIEQKHIDFLNFVNDTIAIAIHSAQSREKVLELLETVQQQKEELENQQEELRQTNEELNVQTEILQTSEEELRVQEEELRQINNELTIKNETIETARQDLINKTYELERSNKYKSEFLANMSHELRTPLNSLLILAKLLADNLSENLTEKQVSHAKLIHKSGSDLLQLINDILDLSKIEAGKEEVVNEDVNLEVLANDIRQLFEVDATQRKIDFSIKVSSELPLTIKSDKQKLEQILKNLVSNALKFTSAHGKVSVQFLPSDNDNFFTITVTDSGIGISESKQQIIFEAFQQADGSTSRKYGGTGLGLSITKQLVSLLNGSITLKSGEGEGSTFSITLPIVSLSLNKPSQMVLPAEPTFLTSIEQTVIKDDRNDIAGNSKSILIIEDDIACATMLRDASRQHGFKTIIATRGDEGMLYTKKYRPVAILLDMKLPGLSGAEILKQLKSDVLLKNIPVHIFSASAQNQIDTSAAVSYTQKQLAFNDIQKALALVTSQLQTQIKKILVIAGEHLQNELLTKLLEERRYEVDCTMASTLEEGIHFASENKYDCSIADISDHAVINDPELGKLHQKLTLNNTPLIVYLDKDVSTADEMALKKISTVVVRQSTGSYNRLMDELELFLFKIQQPGPGGKKQYESNGLQTHELAEKKILLVDDDMRNVFALSAALEQEHINVITAYDGQDALNVLKQNLMVDLVLMDIMMPEMDGYEAIRQIRNNLNLTQLPIIALTAKAMTGDREKCIEAGASDYITKPVDIQKLLSLMRVWLS